MWFPSGEFCQGISCVNGNFSDDACSCTCIAEFITNQPGWCVDPETKACTVAKVWSNTDKAFACPGESGVGEWEGGREDGGCGRLGSSWQASSPGWLCPPAPSSGGTVCCNAMHPCTAHIKMRQLLSAVVSLCLQTTPAATGPTLPAPPTPPRPTHPPPTAVSEHHQNSRLKLQLSPAASPGLPATCLNPARCHLWLHTDITTAASACPPAHSCCRPRAAGLCGAGHQWD